MLYTLLLQSTIFIIAYMVLFFFIAQYLHNITVVDIAWGSGFAIVALFTLLKTDLFLPRQLLVTTLVLIWALRLATHLYLRIKNNPEDPRYQKFREQWGSYFLLYSFFKIFMLQAILIIIIGYSIIVINASSQDRLYLLDALGLFIWIIGFLFETIGDYQLKKFLALPSNHNKIMDKGLWRYTRHPNYFGESMMWWGIFVIALSVDYGWTAIISPVTITILLIFVTGIPMTEQPYAHNSEYQTYKKRTSSFFPWFTR